MQPTWTWCRLKPLPLVLSLVWRRGLKINVKAALLRFQNDGAVNEKERGSLVEGGGAKALVAGACQSEEGHWAAAWCNGERPRGAQGQMTARWKGHPRGKVLPEGLRLDLLKRITRAFRYDIRQTGRIQELIFRFCHIYKKKKKKVKASGLLMPPTVLGFRICMWNVLCFTFFDLPCICFFNDRHVSN